MGQKNVDTRICAIYHKQSEHDNTLLHDHLGSRSRVAVAHFDPLARDSNDVSDKHSFLACLVASVGLDDVLETDMPDLPFLQLLGEMTHDEAKLDIDRFVPFLMRVSLTGELFQVGLATAVRTTGKNFCDKTFIVLVEGKHRLVLMVLSPGRVNGPSSSVLESDTDNVVDALSDWHGRVFRGVSVEQHPRVKHTYVNLFDLGGVAYSNVSIKVYFGEAVGKLQFTCEGLDNNAVEGIREDIAASAVGHHSTLLGSFFQAF